MADDVDHLGAQSPRDNTSAHFTHSRNTTLIGSPTLTRIHSREELTTNIMPGAFAYAPDLDLDTASEDAVLSFYLDNSEPHPSEYRMPAKPLLDYIKHSGLVREFRHRITDVLKMIVRIGDLLFPPTYQLNDEVKARILHYAKWMGQYMRAVVGHIQRRIDKADEGLGKLPPPKVVDKDQLALSIATWTQVIDTLHLPSGREAYIFRQLSALYSSHIYQPFLQFHRTDPDHDMWSLEPQLTPISLILRDAAMLAGRADGAVTSIEDEFEVTMSCQPGGAPSEDGGGGGEAAGERGKRHVTSKSAPVLLVDALRAVPRQRENTL